MKLPWSRARPAVLKGRAAIPLRRHLFALVVAVLLPALAFGGAASWAALRSRTAAAEARMLETAGAYAAAINMQITGQLAALSVLSAASRLDPGQAPRFEMLARDTASIFGGWVVLLDPDGRIILNTASPNEVVLASAGTQVGSAIREAVDRALRTGQPVVTDLAHGQLPGQTAAFVLLPVIQPGQPGRAIGMPLRSDQLTRVLATASLGGSGAVALTDSQGVFVAHSRDAANLVGRQGPPRAAQPPNDDPAQQDGLIHGRSVADGTALRIAWHTVDSAPGWTIWVNEPEAVFAAALRGPILALTGGGLLALGLGALLARALSRRMLHPVEALVEHAEAVAAGDSRMSGAAPLDTVTPATSVLEFERLRRAVIASERALREAESQYRRVQAIGRVGSFMVDLMPTEPRRSTDLVGLEGRPPRAEEAGHEAWLRRLHPDDRERADAYFRQVTADNAPDLEYAQNYRLIEPNGEHRWISARAQIDRDAKGRAIRMIGAHVDISALKQAEAALRDGEERLRLALEAAGMGAWEADLRSGMALRTPRALAIFGFEGSDRIGPYPAWRERIHVEDRPALDDAVAALRSGTSDSYEITYRFHRPDGQWRWLEVHARAAERHPVTKEALRMIGTVLDVTERREAAERQTLLTREVDHRAKNALAMVNAALRLTPRDDADAFANTVEGRVNALARAHTLLAEAKWTGASLRDVVAGELGAFLVQDMPSGGSSANGLPQASMEGPTLQLGPTAVQALSMAFHELATNATKYGALSVPGGRLAIQWRVDEQSETEDGTLHITWQETGVVLGSEKPTRRGFGSNLVEATIRRQLAGQLQIIWRPQGLLWSASLPLARMRFDGMTPQAGAASRAAVSD